MPYDERESWCVRAARSRGRVRHLLLRHDFRRPSGSTALRRAGVPAALYHGKLGNDEKRAAQRAFMSGRAPVMVATSGFGMGIDKPDVRYVVCCGMPLSVEATINRSGRAGARRKTRRHDHAVGQAGPANRFVHGGSGRRKAKTARNVPGKEPPSTCGISAGTKTPAGVISFCVISAKPLMTEVRKMRQLRGARRRHRARRTQRPLTDDRRAFSLASRAHAPRYRKAVAPAGP